MQGKIRSLVNQNVPDLRIAKSLAKNAKFREDREEKTFIQSNNTIHFWMIGPVRFASFAVLRVLR